jgi:hypothetical protein
MVAALLAFGDTALIPRGSGRGEVVVGIVTGHASSLLSGNSGCRGTLSSRQSPAAHVSLRRHVEQRTLRIAINTRAPDGVARNGLSVGSDTRQERVTARTAVHCWSTHSNTRLKVIIFDLF